MQTNTLPHCHGEEAALPHVRRELERMEEFQTVAEIFRQLADPTRVRIFWLLCHCEQCVVNLSAMLAMSSPAISHHLRALKNSELIVGRREGKEVYYRAADTRQSALLHQMIEQVMDISCPKQGKMPLSAEGEQSAYPAQQTEIVKKIHQELLTHMDRRVTIEELSAQYHINPTTLKNTFKSVYGTSLAAHIKEHRMEKAALLLTQTDLPVSQIAQSVGYDNQSKFTAAFKAFFDVLPRDYRKNVAAPISHTKPCEE